MNCVKPIEITQDLFGKEKKKCDNELVFYCGHVVSELKEFYPDEYYMLELLSSGQVVDFLELSEGESFIQHLIKYGIIARSDNKYCSRIPVIDQHIGIELARKEKRHLVYKLIPEEQRVSWLSRRLEEIVTDIRVLEKIINRNNGMIIFGASSFPEADRFKDIGVVDSKDKFVSFINICNRCFVEAIDSHGRAIGNNQYFWNGIKDEYPALHSVLHKIRVYRNEVDHLELNHSVNEQYLAFIKEDLEGKPPSQVTELYFLLQQRILDGLLYNTQIEMIKQVFFCKFRLSQFLIIPYSCLSFGPQICNSVAG